VSNDQLLALMHQAAQEKAFWKAQPPRACPNDGWPLDVFGSVRHCPQGDYEWPRDGDPLNYQQ